MKVNYQELKHTNNPMLLFIDSKDIDIHQLSIDIFRIFKSDVAIENAQLKNDTINLKKVNV